MATLAVLRLFGSRQTHHRCRCCRRSSDTLIRGGAGGGGLLIALGVVHLLRTMTPFDVPRLAEAQISEKCPTKRAGRCGKPRRRAGTPGSGAPCQGARAYADCLLKTVEFVVDAQLSVPALACVALSESDI